MELKEHIITTDVLIVGGGFAGCFAAIRAQELGVQALIAEANKSGLSGASAMGPHLTRVLLPEDDHEAAFKSCVVDSDYMVDQEYAEGAIDEVYERFQEFLAHGANFERYPNGDICWIIEQSINPFFKQRLAMFDPFGSHKHVTNIKKSAIGLGAKVLDRLLITDLITSEGKVVGAVGFNVREGDFYIFMARSVVVATGSSAVLASNCEGPAASYTGDGIIMALRAGAQLRGMEFGRVETGAASRAFFELGQHQHITEGGAQEAQRMFRDLYSGKSKPGLVNANGEEFMEKYELLCKRPDRRYGGPPWKNIIPAILKECKEGRGPCYMQRAPGMPGIEIGIGGHFLSQCGGIRIDPNGVSTIPGLFAGGIASDMCCAPHYSVPANILGSHITGRRAGESAANYAKGLSDIRVDDAEVNRLKKEVYAPMEQKKGSTEKEVRIKMIEAWPRLDLRNEENLNKAFHDFLDLSEQAGSLMADDFHELVKCHKVRNILQIAQATALAARERRETRLEHFREDYPLVNNKDILKWVIIHGAVGDMEATLEDVPIEDWKFQPESEMVDRLEPVRGYGK